MTLFYRDSPGFNYHAMTQNKEFLKDISKICATPFDYSINDMAITISIDKPNNKVKEVALFGTMFEYQCLDQRKLARLIDQEIDRLTTLQIFNPKIENIGELKDLSKQLKSL